jgi:hypothetical protein
MRKTIHPRRGQLEILRRAESEKVQIRDNVLVGFHGAFELSHMVTHHSRIIRHKWADRRGRPRYDKHNTCE